MNYILKNIKLLNNKDKYLMFDGDSLRLFELDKINYEYLDNILYNRNNLEEYITNNPEFKNLVKELMEQQIIVDEKDYLDELKKLEEKDNDIDFTHLTLSISNDCNLNCKYCFGDGGTYHKNRELMTFETAKKSIDFFVKNSGNANKLYVVFFGGEPLINFKVMKRVTEYCSEISKKIEKKFFFSVSTNGTILTPEILNFLVNNNINITLSIDGPEAIHDHYRSYKNGNGSYNIIKENLDKINSGYPDYRKKISARATICKSNLDLIYIENKLRELSFRHINMTLVDVDVNSPQFIGSNDIEIILNKYSELAEQYINDIKSKKVNRNKVFDDVIYALYNKKMKLKSCGAATTSFVVNPKGDIYPCHRFMGDDNYLVGNIEDKIFENKIEIFKSTNVLNIDGCKECWARFICAGSCIHSRAKHSSILKAHTFYCDVYRGFYEIALYIYYDLKNWNENVFKEIKFQ